jgi:hypothetical protein
MQGNNGFCACPSNQAAAALAEHNLTFTYAGPTQLGWGYASPLGQAVVWFSAEQTLPPDSQPSAYQFMTSSGQPSPTTPSPSSLSIKTCNHGKGMDAQAARSWTFSTAQQASSQCGAMSLRLTPSRQTPHRSSCQ